LKEGQVIAADMFKVGDLVDVIGVSKGKGFAGGVKRYNFRGGPKTHGQSDRWRAPGSVGSTTTPGRVLKGQRMAGHMGVDRVTVRNLQVIEVNTDRNLILVKGAIPGPRLGLVMVNKAL
jgi:large subunit ribosomal protein L3